MGDDPCAECPSELQVLAAIKIAVQLARVTQFWLFKPTRTGP